MAESSQPEPDDYLDIFPKYLVSAVPELSRMDLSGYRELPSKTEITPFVYYLDGFSRRMYFVRKPFDRRLFFHFHHTVRGLLSDRPAHKRRTWGNVLRRLERPAEDDCKNNVDVRTCFHWDSHYFVVKPYYVTGQRRVERGTEHVLQLGNNVCYFYYVPTAPTGDITLGRRILKPGQEIFYSKNRLHAGQAYRIPADTVYVLYTYDLLYFSIHIVKESTSLTFETVSPFRGPGETSPYFPGPVGKRKRLLSERPPATPQIDDYKRRRRRLLMEKKSSLPSFSSLPEAFSGSSVFSSSSVPDVFPPSNGPDVFPSSRGTDVFPSSSVTDVFPSSSVTDVFPPSNGTETFPPSNGTETFPSSNVPDVFPSSSVPDVFPSSSVPDVFPPSNGTETFPLSNATETFPPSNATETFPLSNATETFPPSNATETFPPSNATETFPPSNATETFPFSSVSEACPSSSVPEACPSSNVPEALAGAFPTNYVIHHRRQYVGKDVRLVPPAMVEAYRKGFQWNRTTNPLSREEEGGDRPTPSEEEEEELPLDLSGRRNRDPPVSIPEREDREDGTDPERVGWKSSDTPPPNSSTCLQEHAPLPKNFQISPILLDNLPVIADYLIELDLETVILSIPHDVEGTRVG